MSNAIEILEHLGRNPAGSRADVDNQRRRDMGSPGSRAALDRDVDALRKSFQGQQTMRCLIATPD